jgi:acetyl esterase/lipase
MPTLAILLITTLLSQPASPPGTPGQNNRGNRNSPQQAAQRFDQLDRNKDGVLTKDEVRRRDFFERADANNDGKITREEAAALAGNAQRRPGQGNQTRPGNNTSQATTDLQVTRDVVYVNRPDNPKLQSLDIYAPKTDTPKPVMIYIHGGGWHKGDKEPGSEEKAKLLATQGWMLVSINYRLSPAITHPAHVQDVAAAVAWIQDSLDTHQISPR